MLWFAAIVSTASSSVALCGFCSTWYVKPFTFHISHSFSSTATGCPGGERGGRREEEEERKEERIRRREGMGEVGLKLATGGIREKG